MNKMLSRYRVIYPLSHPMSEMINLNNLKRLIRKHLYQEILSSSTNITEKSMKKICQQNLSHN